MANALTMKAYGLGLKHLMQGDVSLTSDTIKFALLDSTTAPNQDTDEYWDDVSANEVTGTGWAAGGVTLASKAVTYDAGSNTVTFDAADISVSTVTISGAAYGIIYQATGTASTSTLLAYGSFATALAATAGTVDITFGAAGILTLDTPA